MNIAIILAGGTGTRMRSDGFPKQYLEIKNKPVLIYTLERFQSCPDVDKIIIVAHLDWHDRISAWVRQYAIDKFACLVPQGETRQESARNGLLACEQFRPAASDIVLIHDAARPLVTPGLITACANGLQGHDGCLPVIPMKDSLCFSPDGHKLANLVDRSTLFCGQSPEAFYLQSYLELNRNASLEDLQKSRACFELAYRNGMDICMVPGEENNFKLTINEDLTRLRNLLDQEESL